MLEASRERQASRCHDLDMLARARTSRPRAARPLQETARGALTGRGVRSAGQKKEMAMLYYAALFFVIALVAALFGFGGIAAGAAGIAKILFFVFLVLFVVSLIAGAMRRGP